MKQSEINEITEKIMALNDDPEKVHEFICACANVKAMLENKLQSETLKATILVGMKNFMNNIRK